ncbi:MAG TPA: helical backbone metal receptor [Anaerolineae bacterium]|nr:helical backbone metal receptor [Anaerolineae bacterium]
MTTQTVTDQMNRTITLPQAPSRIISLVPSQTELLIHLGLAAALVGRTTFCIHPSPQINNISTVGGTKKFRFDRIDQLQPDLIIGNKEENYQDGIEQLAQQYPVWMSDIYTLDDALNMIQKLGELLNKTAVARQLTTNITTAFNQLTPLTPPRRTAYLIWQKPFMAVGQHTFIHDLLTRCGFDNVFANYGDGRYPQITLDQLQQADLDLLLLSSEPFPFTAKHQQELEIALGKTAVRLVDGEMFSWYGNRLLPAAHYLQNLVETI